MSPILNKVITLWLLLLLSACVTQQYDNDDALIIENEASINEMAMTRISLGLGYLKMGNTTQAKFNLEKAKRFSPKLIQVHSAFAHYYDTVGEPELAIASYEEALSINPQDADTLNNYGVFLCRQERLDEAEKQFLKAIAVPSYIKVSESYENLALCQLKAEQFKKAEEYFNKAITHSPNRASTLLQMARLQYAKEDFAQAKIFMQQFEKTTRRFSAEALALSYKVHLKLKDLQTAKNYGAMLVKMFPASYEAKQYLLNGLVEIDADLLAQQYRLQLQQKNKKRVVVLKAKPTAVAKKTSEKVVKKNNTVTVKPTSKDNNSRVKKKPEVKSKQQVIASTADNFLQKNTNKASALVNSSENKKIELSKEKTVLTDNYTAKKSTQKMLSIPVHIVKKGDSVFTISVKYDIKMKSLFKWNKLNKKSTLRIGDVIYLANPAKVVLNEQ